MKRIEQLFQKLGYDRNNGLFFINEADEWMGKFPYRIGRVLSNIIRPYAFYSPFYGVKSTDPEHPEPLNNPIILFFDHPDENIEQNIPRWTFSFSQAPIVIINRDDFQPLDIYHGYDFNGKERTWLKKIEDRDTDIDDFSILNLITGKTWEKLYEKYFKNTPRVDKYLLKNIIDARRILIAKDTGGLSPTTANRLIGRLLFLRYLIDRDVSLEDNRFITGENKTERQKGLEDLLRDKEKAYCFFKSITESFNGDLFPLLEKDQQGRIIYDEEKAVEQRHLDVIRYLFTCSEFFKETGNWKGYMVQESLFNFYDFEVIPVELISNIYENFLAESPSGKNLGELPRQKEIKAYYTPPFLVDYILSETVIPHLAKQEKASCKVLDPACGSGIFLVETLRKLIEKEMELTPKPWPGNKPVISDRRLWELVQENIFGIDIDGDAVEITIFSIYITLLDYKNPKEIKSFRFKKIKGKNLFGGQEADFFNENHPFNKIFKDEVHLDFIIGNPPWGSKVPGSKYNEYIVNRSNREKKDSKTGTGDLEISGNEISQAFMVRTSDLASPDKKTGCSFVVTGKNLYNTDAAKWRNYFLNHFCISKVFELSAINNKNTGGAKVFEKAKQSAVVISFSHRQNDETPGNSLIIHVTARANYYWNCFKTIIIEKQDVKKIRQKYFMETRGGYDWLWKVLLHGNLLDFHFIRRLKENCPTLAQVMDEYNLTFKGGLKPVDNSIKPENRKSTDDIRNWKYLEINESKRSDEFQQFIISSTKYFKEKLCQWVKTGRINADEKVAQLPDIYFFKGIKLLLKNGLSPDFRAFAAVYDEDFVFTDSICSIKAKPGEASLDDIYLHALAGLLNSDFFTYFVLITGSSAGIERTRANFADFFNFPTIVDKQIGVLSEKIKEKYEKIHSTFPTVGKKELLNEIESLREGINNVIANRYEIAEEEKALIDYAINVSIPVFKRQARGEIRSLKIFRPLSMDIKEDRDYLQEYAEVFIDHFGQRFNGDKKYFVVDVHVTPSFIGFHFKISPKPEPDTGRRTFFIKDIGVEEMINKIGELGYHKLSKGLYVCQDIRGFNKTSFYVIKPNQKKSWHKATAYADLSEFIESLVKAEIEKKYA